MHKNKLGIAIAAVLLTVVTVTAQADNFTGATTVVALTVNSKDGNRSGQFLGYVAGEDVSPIVTSNPQAQKFDNQKDLLVATATFLSENIQQDDVAVLTDNTTNLGAMFRDMQQHGITIPSMSCLSKVNNVPEVLAMHAGGATINQFGRDNNIDVAGIEQNPILRAECIHKIYQQLLVRDSAIERQAVNA